MKTKDFEQAVEALGIQDLEIIRYSYGVNGMVVAVYAKMGQLTWIKWDSTGRGFRFDHPADMEDCISEDHVMYLDYRRDSYFDLTFS